MPDAPSTPALLPRSQPHIRQWALLWILTAALLAVLLSFNGRLDTLSWCATRWFFGDREYYTWSAYSTAHAQDPAAPFYATTPPPFSSRLYARTERLWTVLKSFGEGWMTLILCFAVALYDRRRWFMAAAFALATSLAGGLGALIRVLDGRFRPTHSDGANVWQLFRGFHDGQNLSFPSGHATLAFATAAALTYLSPRGTPLFLAVAAGTAASRVIMGAHFWSDSLFGAALGWSVAWFIMYHADRLDLALIKKRQSATHPG